MKISTVSQMRALDRTAIDEYGIKEELLMENAGEAVYFVISRQLGVRNMKFLVFCGMGNNGGDGFVIARKLHSGGAQVKVFVLGDPGKYKGAAKLNVDIVSRLPIEVTPLESAEALEKDLYHCHGIVDAIFGTGLSREVAGLHGEVIERINRSPAMVFSADIPSGVHGDTGQVMGTAVQADFTVTFGLPKLGNIFFPGYALCGNLSVTHISFPPSMYHQTESMKVAINPPLPLPPRKRHGHKGDMGDVLFVAGAAGYLGAPYFAARSFLKAGGGYSRLAAPRSITPFIANKGSEIVFMPQPESRSGGLTPESAELLDMAAKVDMVVIGPGLGLEEGTQALVRDLARKIDKPLLVDGDGITALCKHLDIIKERRSETVLTPHPGEMSRIVNMTVADIEQNKVNILQRTVQELNAIIVLKGAHSLIGLPDQQVFINMSGNSGMATAGSGDVLTGTIAAMFGLGLSLESAVRKGVFIHGLAGDLAAEATGEDGITAQDIMEYLPAAMTSDRTGLNEEQGRRYQGPEVI